jgi:hypothetical protein
MEFIKKSAKLFIRAIVSRNNQLWKKTIGAENGGMQMPEPGLSWDDEKFYVAVIIAGSLLIWLLVIYVVWGGVDVSAFRI